MSIDFLLVAVNRGGYFNGLIIGAVVGPGIGIVYELCFGGRGRQA